MRIGNKIKEISKENFVEIGNHSHSHEYLADEDIKIIENDIVTLSKFLKKI